jgi:hypothetical protein
MHDGPIAGIVDQVGSFPARLDVRDDPCFDAVDELGACGIETAHRELWPQVVACSLDSLPAPAVIAWHGCLLPLPSPHHACAQLARA